MATVKPHQIKKIHTLKSVAGIDEDTYRDMLAKKPYEVSSSKDLSWTKANLLIAELAKAAGQTYNGPRKVYSDNKGMASAYQKKMLLGMWKDVSHKKTDKERAAAFNRFLSGRFGVSHLEWLTRDKVEKVAKALIAMGARRPEEYLEDIKNKKKEECHG